MNKFFYARLALQNIRKNGRFYFPYMITGALIVSMFYNMIYCATNPELAGRSNGSFSTILMLGTIVIGLFSIVFILYTNSFLMKRRQKELGLYNILGMEKRHIARIMLWETVFSCFITVIGGLLIGILLSKLLMLLVFKLIHFTVQYGFTVSIIAVVATVLLFCGIYFLALLHNLRRVHQSKPIELLHGGEVGEKEPKTKWLLVLIGVLSLGAGYAIALIVESPLQALALFFVAVLLVIIGTYCLFTAGSIALLKCMRRKKSYYYQTKHFTGISGMLYRMKKNAVGLANVCILCTMVLVTVSTTVCTYIGTEDALTLRFPTDVELDLNVTDNPEVNTAAFQKDIEKIAAKHGLSIEDKKAYTGIDLVVSFKDNIFSFTDGGGYGYITTITANQYQKLTGKTCNLAPDEILLYTNSTAAASWEDLTLGSRNFKIKAKLDAIPLIENDLSVYVNQAFAIVVPDETTLTELRQEYQASPVGSGRKLVMNKIYFNLSGTDEDVKSECYRDIVDQLAGEDYTVSAPDGAEGESQTYYLSMYQSRQESRDDFYNLYGGLLFVGIFLGVLFLLGTVLIIYYKQISEGYEDKERFEIMQKVGMTHEEVRGSIRGQILIVFFLPLVAALIHLAAAFKMITRLLVVLNLTNVGLFAICTVATMAVFALVYAGVYALTARTYYRIIES